MTFSIAAKCPETGQFGVAAATAMPAVGKLLTHARAKVGAIATQAQLNPYLGIDGLALLQEGLSAEDVLATLKRQDPRADTRQFAVVDQAGETAAWTGHACPQWSGDVEGNHYAAQGNRLAGPHVLDALVDAMDATVGKPLADRFLAALEAGVNAGGDTKGEVSATIYIVDTEDYPLWDIRVDHHERPIEELHRLHDLFCAELLPEIRKMPTRANPAGAASEHSA